MSTKMKDLEIVYNLRWRNGPKKDDKKQMSIVAVFDIPSTTLNFDVFKSYLLKNSGTPEDDVNVSYIMDNGKEFLITTQLDFQVALYAFRRKARANEVIQLLLERISEKKTRKVAKSTDAETQFDTEEHHSVVSTISTCCNIETPPEWFIASMAQLKLDIQNDMSTHVSAMMNHAVTDLKQYVSSCMSRRPRMTRKCKPENDEKTSRKSSKLEHKLEHKLEKLELKASKYREKRLALLQSQKSSDNAPKSSDSDAGPSTGRSRSRDKGQTHKQESGKREREEILEKFKRTIALKEQQIKADLCDAEEEFALIEMNARPVKTQKSLPHMLGGEIYLHQWEVENIGTKPWTSATKLEYTWGSKKLLPFETTIAVPNLQPAEKGVIYVRLQVPNEAGSYESYWHFTHKQRRFGQWLGVQLIVDPFDLKGNSSVLENATLLGATATSAVECKVDATKTEGEAGRSYMEHCLNDYENYLDDMRKKALQEISTSEKIIKKVELVVSPPLSPVSWSSGLSSLQGNSSSKDELEEYFLLPSKEAVALLDEKASADDAGKMAESRGSVSEKSVNLDYIVVPSPQISLSGDSDSSYDSLPKKDEPTKPSTSDGPTQPENFDDNNNTENKSNTSSGSIRFRDEDLDNMVVITVPIDEQIKEDFMCVHVDGQKVLIPKNILKSEVVTAAQNSDGVVFGSSEIMNKPTSSRASTATIHESPRQSCTPKPEDNTGNTLDSVPPKNLEEPLIPQSMTHQQYVAVDLSTGSKEENVPQIIDEGMDRSTYYDPTNYMSHCSAAGSCFSEINGPDQNNSRLFVFPQNIPGYEVVSGPVPTIAIETQPQMHHPAVDVEAQNAPVYNIPPPMMPNPFVEHVHQPPLGRVAVDPGTDPLYHYNQPWSTPTVPSYADPQQQYVEPQMAPTAPCQEHQHQDMGVPHVHILPETLVAGAVSAASSAMSTARSVFNMIRPQPPGRWVNGHWVSTSAETPREANLQALAEMGFWNRDLNATLLARFNDDLNRVVAELVR